MTWFGFAFYHTVRVVIKKVFFPNPIQNTLLDQKTRVARTNILNPCVNVEGMTPYFILTNAEIRPSHAVNRSKEIPLSVTVVAKKVWQTAKNSPEKTAAIWGVVCISMYPWKKPLKRTSSHKLPNMANTRILSQCGFSVTSGIVFLSVMKESAATGVTTITE